MRGPQEAGLQEADIRKRTAGDGPRETDRGKRTAGSGPREAGPGSKEWQGAYAGGLNPVGVDRRKGPVVVRIVLVQGDITAEAADAVVNAANSSLLGGGGVDGAIHRKGGPEILAACQDLRRSHYGKGLPTGRAVATTAGRLPARHVIHTVGPVWSRDEDRSELLASCYRESLRVADELGDRTVAFPAISTGVYGWPMDDGARIAVETVRAARTEVEEVRFVLFDASAYAAFEAAVGDAAR